MSGDFPCDVTSEREKLYPGEGSPRGYLDGKEMSFDQIYSEEDMKTLIKERLKVSSALAIDMTATISMCKLKITNSGTSSLKGKLFVILMENDIAVPSSDWDIKIAHSVPRASLANASGETVSLETGETMTKEFEISLESSYNKENCRVVAFVQKEDKEIMQAAEVTLQETGILTKGKYNNSSDVPHLQLSKSVLTLQNHRFTNEEVSLAILDIRGRLLWSKSLTITEESNPHLTLSSSLANGLYLVKISSKESTRLIPLSICR